MEYVSSYLKIIIYNVLYINIDIVFSYFNKISRRRL